VLYEMLLHVYLVVVYMYNSCIDGFERY